MFVIIVQAQITQDHIQDFINATLDNARNSLLEPGVARFDFYQQADDPSRFTLIEIYRDQDAPGKHRESAHYNKWKTTVEKMMVEPRTRITYNILFPPSIDK